MPDPEFNKDFFLNGSSDFYKKSGNCNPLPLPLPLPLIIILVVPILPSTPDSDSFPKILIFFF